MTRGSGRTPVGQSNDGPSHPPLPKARIMHTTPSAHTSGKHARLGEKRALMEALFLRQSRPSPPPSQIRTEPLVRYGRVIAPRLDRGQRHPGSQHRSTEAVKFRRHAEPKGALGQSLKRPGGGEHPVVPSLGSAARPNPFQPLNTAWRRDVGQAVFGSVPPKTFPRKSSHLS